MDGTGDAHAHLQSLRFRLKINAVDYRPNPVALKQKHPDLLRDAWPGYFLGRPNQFLATKY